MERAAPVRQFTELREYDVGGPEDAPTIVFIHANSWTRKMWLPQMRALADSYHLLAPDLPGHGALAGVRFGLDAAVQQIERVRAEQRATPILLVGLSLGGYVAMAYARRHPEQIAGLALAGCSVRFEGRIRAMTQMSAVVFSLIGHGPFLTRLTRRHIARVRARYPAELAEAQIQAGFYFAGWGRALAQMAAADSYPTLAAFPRPLLILNGENDTYNRQAEAACATIAPGAMVRVIERAGHICNLDCPDHFTAEVRAFASSLAW